MRGGLVSFRFDLGKPRPGLRPYFFGWRRAELPRVALQGFGIPVFELNALRTAAGSRIVMQRLTQHRAAKLRPVAAGIDHMQMPRLIHILTGCHRMPRHHSQIEKAPVFSNNVRRLLGAPAVLTGQTGAEIQNYPGSIECE